ncbi:UPF0481 protein At3g47200-like [Camellia sinensis]|uniref:Uncharacterized protein n=1 Tax=Camellia sinensis var. sinensis TaxID=542762 RepID=A0A4S4DW85_CAMSN|nr:UPF0481 protein At3g47200-like [Camellia sinensis]THG07045.1 hypothetical protein TEA_014404 [Camellia sinensis var. sinensis]
MENGEHQAITIEESDSNIETSVGSTNEIEESSDNACVILIQRRLEENRREGAQSTTERDISSICRVPENLARISRRATEPEKVSIGPYHRDKDEVLEFQSFKWQFLDSLLSRMEQPKSSLRLMTLAMKELELKARAQYSELIQMSSDDFIEMMLLDGCFIIELFQQVCQSEDSANVNSLVLMKPWLIPILIRDLLKLENQIPLFVLLELFSLSNFNTREPFLWQALKFFNLALPRSLDSFKGQQRVSLYEDSCHLLHLFYCSYCCPKLQQAPHRPTVYRPEGYRPSSDQSIPCVTRLRHAGVKFRPLKAGNFLDINFHKGVLGIPPMTINDFTSTVLINCVACEQCYPRPNSKCFSEYIAFISCLINSSRDVTFLCEDGIISNFSYNDNHVANLFNMLGEHVVFNIRECYLKNEFREVEAYYSSDWATLRRTYFSSPWSIISVASASALLLLTALQTFAAYVEPRVLHS